MAVRPVLQAVRWGSVVIGGTAGLLAMAVISFGGFLTVEAVGGSDGVLLGVVAIANFTAQVLAGWVAGRFAASSQVLNGSLAGLGFFAVSTTLQILDGGRPHLLTLVLFGALSALLGAAGGRFAARRR